MTTPSLAAIDTIIELLDAPTDGPAQKARALRSAAERAVELGASRSILAMEPAAARSAIEAFVIQAVLADPSREFRESRPTRADLELVEAELTGPQPVFKF